MSLTRTVRAAPGAPKVDIGVSSHCILEKRADGRPAILPLVSGLERGKGERMGAGPKIMQTKVDRESIDLVKSSGLCKSPTFMLQAGGRLHPSCPFYFDDIMVLHFKRCNNAFSACGVCNYQAIFPYFVQNLCIR